MLYWMLAVVVAMLVPVVIFSMQRQRAGRGERIAGRVVLLSVLTVLTLGFGACGGIGSFGGISLWLDGSAEGRAYYPLFLVPGLAGLVLAMVLAWLIGRWWRPRRAGAHAPSAGLNTKES